MRFYGRGPRAAARFEDGIRLRRAVDPRATRGSCSGPSARPPAIRPAGNYRIARHRARLATVVLPLGLGARSAAGAGGDAEVALDARRPRGRSPAHAGRPARRGARRRASPRSGCGCRTSTRSGPTACSIPTGIARCRRRSAARPSCSSSHLVREDRSVRDLLTADYSFVNERIARHYGIPNVTGDEFRKVTLPRDAARHPRPGQRAAADVGGRSHLAGAARQVGDAGAARLAAAAAAARTCRCSKRPRTPTARAC